MGDLQYLCTIGLDAKDAQLAKEKGHIENRIAHWDVKLTTAKFLHDKVYQSYAYLFSYLYYRLHRVRKKEATVS